MIFHPATAPCRQAEDVSVLHRVKFSSGLGCERLRTSRDVSLLWVTFTAGAPSARAAHILNPPEMVPTWQQHPVAVKLQIVSGAFLRGRRSDPQR